MALICCLFAGCTGGDKSDADENTQTPDAAEAAEAPDAEDFFWLAANYRFDCVPYFDEGRAPSSSADYLMYAFIMNGERLTANDLGYIQMSASVVDETAEKYFKVKSLEHASDDGLWDYDEDTKTYTATGWGYANEPSYILKECKAEDTEAGRVYTVSCSPLSADEFSGMELSPYFVIDFDEHDYTSDGLRALHALIKDSGVYKEDMTYGEAIAALMEAGLTDEIPTSPQEFTFKFCMEDGRPVFLAHGQTGEAAAEAEELTAERFFELAIDERFDYIPFFDEGNAPRTAGEYLMYTFILNERELKEKAVDYVKMPASLVDETAEKHFQRTNLEHKSFEGLWEYDPKTEEYTATGWGYSNERIFIARSIDKEKRGSRTIYTVWAAPADIEEFDVMMNTDTPVAVRGEHDDWPPSENLRALDELIKKSGVYEDGMTYREAIAALIREGRGEEIPLAYEKDKFVFYFDGDTPVYLAHYVDYSD